MYDDVLALLTGPLKDVAPARDASGTWRALQARATGAQRYGAWALQALGDEAYTLRQWSTLARHADMDVRARSRHTIDSFGFGHQDYDCHNDDHGCSESDQEGMKYL